jgi:hypothetical protein
MAAAAPAEALTGLAGWARTWGTTAAERRLPFACDRHLPRADDAVYRAVDVAAPAAALFRWLCQLRVAPYSYDWIDNRGRQSPRCLLPGLDVLAIGQRFMGVFDLVDFEVGRSLTLCTQPSSLGTYAVTYVALPVDAERCRLVVKLVMDYPALVRPVLRVLAPIADLVMMRKQLLTLKGLAEQSVTP